MRARFDAAQALRICTSQAEHFRVRILVSGHALLRGMQLQESTHGRKEL